MEKVKKKWKAKKHDAEAVKKGIWETEIRVSDNALGSKEKKVKKLINLLKEEVIKE